MGGAGHAVMIVDMARTEKGRVLALLGEGDIPAQDFHIMKTESGGDWFLLPAPDFKDAFLWPTPFTWKDLKGFAGSGVVRAGK